MCFDMYAVSTRLPLVPTMRKNSVCLWLAVWTMATMVVQQTQAQSSVLIPRGSSWKYLDDGSNQGTVWRGTNFNDSAWQAGPGELGYGDDADSRPEQTRLNYGPDANNKYITTYFRKAFVVADPSAYSTLTLSLLRDDGAVVYLNGAELFRDGMPTGDITYTTPANITVSGTDEATYFPSNVSATLLRPGTNFLAVEIHQVNGPSSDISFDLELKAPVPPQVTLTSPTNGATFGIDFPVTLTASASDDVGIVRVEFYRGVLKLGEVLTAPYSLVWSNLTEGLQVLTAVATDTDGASTVSSPVTVTVTDTNIPVLVSALGNVNGVQVNFSKLVSAATATNPANYRLSGGALVQSATLSAGGNTVLLATTPLGLGSSYTLTANNITDTTGHSILPDSQVTFLVVPFLAADVGSPTSPGMIVPAANGYDMTANGADIGGGSDSFSFFYQTVNGDFDFKVRVAALSLSDAWAKAGLMARDYLVPNSRFAAVLASPSVSGSCFQARVTSNTTATTSGALPVNYPYTWLRLKRSGSSFIGYASLDGQTWQQLGSATLTMPTSLAVGFAVCSHTLARTTTAQFREFGDVTGGTIVTSLPLAFEPPGPASRNSGLIISEIMYHPRFTNDLEFIELFNASILPEDLSGYRLTGDIHYTFPTNVTLPAGGYLVVARKPALLQQAYGITGVYGPWVGADTNALSDGSGVVRLWNRNGGLPLEVHYKATSPWPLAADGNGHSLVLARPSYGQDNVKAWAASDRIGGSPGGWDSVGPEPLRNVVINEFLANSDPPQQDYIELYNHGPQAVDLSGAWLSDDRDTNVFRIPDGTALAARGFRVYTESELGFALSSRGGRIYLVNSNQNRVLQAVSYDGAAPGISSGRYPDGGEGFFELKALTPGTTNSGLYLREIVINEIMFNPISGDDNDQYVELYNRGTNALNVGGWRFQEGISYTFPADTLIAANGYLVVAKNAAHLIPNYPQLSAANTVGDFGGALSHGGERIALAAPELVAGTNAQGAWVTNVNWMIRDEVTYCDSGRWTQWADGGGSSLELIDPSSDNRLAANWADSDETLKGEWTNVVFSERIDNVFPVPGSDGSSQLLNEFQVMLLGGGEVLMDNVGVQTGGAGTTNANLVLNPDFSGGLNGWLRQGNHVRSSLEPVGPKNPSPSMRLRASSGGDNGANRVECDLSAALSANTLGTLSGRFRWLCGAPYVLMRLHGGGLEVVTRLPTPANLGTPGLPNSRLLANAGPAIYDVVHSPVSPAAGQAVLVTARVSDPDGVASAQLLYRVDPNTTATALIMRDDGLGGDAVAGDGLYSATLPGQAAGSLVAFRVSATDAHAPVGTSVFPPDAPVRECLVRFGDPASSGNVPTYRLWVTGANISSWSSRERLSNEPVDGTLAINDFRVIYNATARYRGSPFIRGGGPTSPTGGIMMYIFTTPDDDPFLGETEMNLDSLEHGGRDSTGLREPMAYWIVAQMGLPFCYQRPIHLVLNGVQDTSRGTPGYIDVQQPNSAYVKMWFADKADGDLFKIDDWFEYNDVVAMQANKSASLEVFTTTNLSGVIPKQARYRWSWEKKVNQGLNDDYSPLYTAVGALNAPDAIYPRQVESAIEADEWMATFALRHTMGDWDGYGYNRGKNQFVYRPRGERFWMLLWDLDFSFGCTGGHGPTQDLFTLALGGATGSDNMPEVSRLYNHPRFRRASYQALQRIADGPLQEAAFGARLDTYYQALLANGVSPVSPYVASGAQSLSIPEWIRQRRAHIYTQLATYSSTAFSVTAPTSVTSNLATLTGTAPFSVQTIRINGREYPLTWTSVTAWSVQVPVVPGGNDLIVQAFDRSGTALPNMSATRAVSFSGLEVSPAGLIVINEIMFDPVVPNAEFVELFNTSSNRTFDLSGWEFNGLSYTFPEGAFLAPRAYLVLAKDRLAFATAYGGGVPVFDTFGGNLQSGAETLALIKPGVAPQPDLVVAQVRYSGRAPWPTNAAGTGSSVQLVDAGQDITRPLNWSSRYTPGVYQPGVYTPAVTNSGWRFVSISASNATDKRVVMYLGSETIPEAGSLYLDDLYLVPGTNAAVGTNYLANSGDFEGAVLNTNIWKVGTNFAASAVTTTEAHSGTASLFLTATTPGAASVLARDVYQTLLTTNREMMTLSFWFLSTTNVTNFHIRVVSSNLKISTNVQPEVVPAMNIPPSMLVAPVVNVTPGAANVLVTNLPAIPPLWLNEVEPVNLTGLADHNGHREPWIELYNSGTNTLSLAGLFLTDAYTNLTNWAFPAGATIAPGEFKVLFADGAPGETVADEWHTGFRLSPADGAVALVRLNAGKPEVLDFINYSGLLPNHSFGSFPDGQLIRRQDFYYPTPALTNDPTSPPLTVFINEWMAANTATLRNPEGTKFDDWFELYNPTDLPQNLSGFYLTDNLTNRFQSLIPPGYVVPPRGYLLVWADGRTDRNNTNHPDLHVSFQLDKDGEALGLFAPDGRMIDALLFGPQTNNLSQGRFPDGTESIHYMPQPTPREPNFIDLGNRPPVLSAIADQTVSLGQTVSFTASATDPESPPQVLAFSLDPGAPAGAGIDPASGAFSWTPLPEQAPGVALITVRVTDNGTPVLSTARSFHVTVTVNTKPTLQTIADQALHLGQTLTLTAQASDPEAPPQTLSFSLDAGAPVGASIHPQTGLFTWTPSEAQGTGTYPITVRVQDDGQPVQQDSRLFTVRVGGKLSFDPATLEDTRLTLQWASLPGLRYGILCKTNLAQPEWIRLDQAQATGVLSRYTVQTTNEPQRFYRVQTD